MSFSGKFAAMSPLGCLHERRAGSLGTQLQMRRASPPARPGGGIEKRGGCVFADAWRASPTHAKVSSVMASFRSSSAPCFFAGQSCARLPLRVLRSVVPLRVLRSVVGHHAVHHPHRAE
jgi:hypothetical protein